MHFFLLKKQTNKQIEPNSRKQIDWSIKQTQKLEFKTSYI